MLTRSLPGIQDGIFQKPKPNRKSIITLRVVHTRALRIWIENIFSDFNFFLSKISRFDRGSNLRSLDFESFSTRMLKPLSYRANQNYSKTNRFYTKQICVGFFHFALFVISCIVWKVLDRCHGIKSPNRNNPTIEKLGVTPTISGIFKKLGFSLGGLFPPFFTPSFFGIQKNMG